MKKATSPQSQIAQRRSAAGGAKGMGKQQAVGDMLSTWAQRSVSGGPRVQAKLIVGEVEDAFEQEADAFAAVAVNGLSAGKGVVGLGTERNHTVAHTPTEPLPGEDLEKEEGSVEEVQTVRPKLHFGGGSSGGTEAPPNLPDDIGQLRGKGSGLPAHLRGHFEGLLGASLGGVRIHTGARSAELNRQIGARAFTLGQDIFFGAGEYDAGSAAGRELLAHEVAHTVQQGREAVVRRREELFDNLTLPIDTKAAINFNRFAWSFLYLKTLNPFRHYEVTPFSNARAFVGLTFELQRDLQQLYSYALRPDGQFGPDTITALHAYFRLKKYEESSLILGYEHRPIQFVMSQFLRYWFDFEERTTFKSSLSELGSFRRLSKDKFWKSSWDARGEDHTELLHAMDLADVYHRQNTFMDDVDGRAALIGFQQSISEIPKRNHGYLDFQTALALDRRVDAIASGKAVPQISSAPVVLFRSRLGGLEIFRNLIENHDWKLSWPDEFAQPSQEEGFVNQYMERRPRLSEHLEQLLKVLDAAQIILDGHLLSNAIARDSFLQFQRKYDAIPLSSVGTFDLATALILDRRLLDLENGVAVPELEVGAMDKAIDSLRPLGDVYALEKRIHMLRSAIRTYLDRSAQKQYGLLGSIGSSLENAFQESEVDDRLEPLGGLSKYDDEEFADFHRNYVVLFRSMMLNDGEGKNLGGVTQYGEGGDANFIVQDFMAAQLLLAKMELERIELLQSKGMTPAYRVAQEKAFQEGIADDLRRFANKMKDNNRQKAESEIAKMRKRKSDPAGFQPVVRLFKELQQLYHDSDLSFAKGIAEAVRQNRKPFRPEDNPTAEKWIYPTVNHEEPIGYFPEGAEYERFLQTRFATLKFTPIKGIDNDLFENAQKLESKAVELLKTNVGEFPILMFRGLEIRKNIDKFASLTGNEIADLMIEMAAKVIKNIGAVKVEGDDIWKLDGVIRGYKKEKGIADGDQLDFLLKRQQDEETSTGIWDILGEIALGLAALAGGPIGWAAFATGLVLGIHDVINAYEDVMSQKAAYGSSIDPEDALSDVEPSWLGFVIACLSLVPDAFDAVKGILKAAGAAGKLAKEAAPGTIKAVLWAEVKKNGQEGLAKHVEQLMQLKDTVIAFSSQFSAQNARKLLAHLRHPEFQAAIEALEELTPGRAAIVAQSLANGPADNLATFPKIVQLLRDQKANIDPGFAELALADTVVRKSLLEFADEPALVSNAFKEWKSSEAHLEKNFAEFLESKKLVRSKPERVPEVVKAPEAPKVPEVVSAPEAPKLPEVVKAPEAPKLPEVVSAPEGPKVVKVKPNPKTKTDPKPKADPKSKTNPKPKADPKPKTNPKPKSDPKPKTNPKPKSDPKAPVIRPVKNDPDYPFVKEEIIIQPGGKMPDVLEQGQRAKFPDGTVVTRMPPGKGYEIKVKVGPTKGRADFEEGMYTGKHVGRPNADRAHASGDILGSEVPYAIYYADRYINRSVQKKIELEIQGIFERKLPHQDVVVTIHTKPHWGSNALDTISYKAEIVDNGSAVGKTVLHRELQVSKDGIHYNVTDFLNPSANFAGTVPSVPSTNTSPPKPKTTKAPKNPKPPVKPKPTAKNAQVPPAPKHSNPLGKVKGPKASKYPPTGPMPTDLAPQKGIEGKLPTTDPTPPKVDPSPSIEPSQINVSPEKRTFVTNITDIVSGNAAGLAIGRHFPDAQTGFDILHRLQQGDRRALEALGLPELPKDFDPTKVEWGLAKMRDSDDYFIVGPNKGDSMDIDWEHIDEFAEPVAHSHPLIDPVRGPRLLQPVNGSRQLDDILSNTTNLTLMFPSAEDLHFFFHSGFKGRKHTVFTPYYLNLDTGDILNQPLNDRCQRINIEFEHPEAHGTLPDLDASPVWKAQAKIVAGDMKYEIDLYAVMVQLTDSEQLGHIDLKPPPGMRPLHADAPD